MEVHRATAKALREAGIDIIFGLLGDANLFMVRAFVEEFGGRFVAAAHEAGATLMATGYSITSGKTGVVSITHGPGLTNALTALVDARKARVPILVICGDTAAERIDHFQKVDQREFVLATGAGFEPVKAPSTICADLSRCFRRLQYEKRPIVMNIPADFEWQATDYSPISPTTYAPSGKPVHNEALDNAIGIIAASRAPIILAGRGSISASSRQAMLSLAERTGAFLATTLKAKGLFRGEPFDLDVFGTLSTPLSSELIAQSDCIIAFGASLNQYTTARGSYVDGKRIIQCNIDPSALGEYVVPDAGLVGDTPSIVEVMTHWLNEAEIPPSGFRSEEARLNLAKQDLFAGVPDTSTERTVDLSRALARIDQAVPSERVFVSDVGRFVGEAWKYISVEQPENFIHTVNFGSIGLSVPYGIGAHLGRDGRPALVVTGDGGFMLGGLTEFHTAVREGADVIVVVCNDSSYGAEHVQFTNRNINPEIANFAWPELADVARSLGGEGIAVSNQEELENACHLIKTRNSPLLIDLKLDTTRMLPLDY